MNEDTANHLIDIKMDKCDGKAGAVQEMEEEQQARIREQNIQALLTGSLEVERAVVLPKYLRITQSEIKLRQPFRCPTPGAQPGLSAVCAPTHVAACVHAYMQRHAHLPAAAVPKRCYPAQRHPNIVRITDAPRLGCRR